MVSLYRNGDVREALYKGDILDNLLELLVSRDVTNSREPAACHLAICANECGHIDKPHRCGYICQVRL